MKPSKYTSIIALLIFAWGHAQAFAELKGSRPNIILVLTDDQGYGDMSCHGHPFLKTPNLDALHAQSTRFTNFHASPTCSPTRGAIMAGKAPFKLGITHTILERERMALSAVTIAEVLKEAGYVTGIFGKWHLGDEDPYQPENRGFDEVFIHGAGGIGQDYPVTCADVPGNDYFDPVIKHNGTFKKTEGYCTDVFFQQALGWIKENKEGPFFAYLATNAPHGPFIVADRYSRAFKDKTKSERDASFFGMISNIDENMGLLMEKLDEWNLSDDTLLIFMTDNGTALGGMYFNAGMRGTKASLHEGGSRVPLFMRWSGRLKAGWDMDRMTRHYDLFPTFAALAGASLPKDIELDGRSLIPLLEYPKDSWNNPWQDRYTFFHQGRWNRAGVEGRWGKGNTDPDAAKYKRFAVRTERWRLVGVDALYDLSNDPSEEQNVFEVYPETAQRLLNAYDDWWDSVRPYMINEDASLDRSKPFIEQFEKQKESIGIPFWAPSFLH